MTLILGSMNRRHAVLVADRRLSWNGKIREDESSKAMTLVCRDARLGIAFTGLAKSGSFVTRQWMLEAFADAAQPDSTLEPIMARFAQSASAKFQEFPRKIRFLTVFCAGFFYDQEGPRGLMLLVSNFERLGSPALAEPSDEFSVSWMREKRPYHGSFAGVYAAGMGKLVPDADLGALQGLLKASKPYRAVVGKSVDMIRNAAASPSSRNAVGRQCTSIMIPSEPNDPAVWEYHSAIKSTVLHGPSHIEARGGPHGVFVLDRHEAGYEVNGVAKIVAGPRLGRNQPCWCGNGKKFKECHGR